MSADDDDDLGIYVHPGIKERIAQLQAADLTALTIDDIDDITVVAIDPTKDLGPALVEKEKKAGLPFTHLELWLTLFFQTRIQFAIRMGARSTDPLAMQALQEEIEDLIAETPSTESEKTKDARRLTVARWNLVVETFSSLTNQKIPPELTFRVGVLTKYYKYYLPFLVCTPADPRAITHSFC